MIQCIIFKFRKWHTCNYEWYRLYRSYENCKRPGVAILDMQMSKVPIISGYDVYRKLSPTQQSFSFRHSAQYSWNITDVPQWCLAVNNRWINHFVIARWRTIFFYITWKTMNYLFLRLNDTFSIFFHLIFVLSFPKKLFR